MAQRLLIVDSDRRFIQEHQAALASTFEVDFLNTTDGALAQLESGQYSAVLLCVEVSENKGYSLCSAIRKAPGTQSMKVALISGKATEEEYARHQSLKGHADLYLHKPMTSNALIAALSPFVPMKMEDPDNPLGDLGGLDVAEEWLESLKTELELEIPPRAKAVPEAASVFSLPLAPLAPALPAVPRDAGRVELLEARVQDLEAKLVAKADELDHTAKELEDLRQQTDSATRNLGDLAPWQAESEQATAALEGRLQELEAQLDGRNHQIEELEAQLDGRNSQIRELETHLEARSVQIGELEARTQEQAQSHQESELALGMLQKTLRELEGQLTRSEDNAAGLNNALSAALAEQERLENELEGAKAQLADQARLSMDTMESNMLLQAQMEEARENAIQHLQTERVLSETQERQNQMEAQLQEKATLCQELEERCRQQEGKLGEMEAKGSDCQLNRERLEASFAELEHQVTTLEANHERQQLELLAGIDERDGQLGRLNATLDAQQERLLTLERLKDELEGKVQAHADRMRALNELCAAMEGQVRSALDLTNPQPE